MTTPKKRKTIITIIILLLVAVSVAVIALLVSRSSKKKTEVPTGFELKTAEENREIWQNTPSDIGGLTLWDKYSFGLALNNGSDTDKDGLTDREELEVYNTDPHLSSTAGDLYTDGYKVANNMNPNEYYVYDGDICFANNFCPEVTLTAQKPEDLNAVVENRTGEEFFNGNAVLAQYEIYNYSGELSIDLTNVRNIEKSDGDRIALFISDGADLQKVKFSLNEKTITPNFDFKTHLTYNIYVVDKKAARFVFGSLMSKTDIRPASAYQNTDGEGLVCCYPVLTELFNVPVKIFYEDQGNEAANEALGEKVLAHAKQYWGKYLNEKQYSENSVKPIGSMALKTKLWLWKLIIPNGNLEKIAAKDIEKNQLFFVYYSYSDRLAYELANPPAEEQEDSGETKPTDDDNGFINEDILNSASTGFDPSTDTLPFANFSTMLAPRGTCVGISHFTAKLYNNGSYYQTGSYGTLSWNIASHSENQTLLDRGLSDYKDKNFVYDHSLDGQRLGIDLSADETEFMKMIEAAYLCGNSAANSIYEKSYGGTTSTAQTDYALIEEMCRRIDSGEVLIAYLKLKDNSCHAVNVYAYKRDNNNPDVIRFSVYDSNFPISTHSDYRLSSTGFVITVIKKLKTNGLGNTFDFEYSPISQSNYGATSNRAVTPSPIFLVLDDNYLDINPTVNALPSILPEDQFSDNYSGNGFSDEGEVFIPPVYDENETAKENTDSSKATITYVPCGGSGGPISQTIKKDTHPRIDKEKPTRDGYHFVGWTRLAGFNSPEYFAGELTSQKFTQNTTLYACWEKYNSADPFNVEACSGKTLNFFGILELFGVSAGEQTITVSHDYHTDVDGYVVRIFCDCGFELIDRDLSEDNFVYIKSNKSNSTYDSLKDKYKDKYHKEYILYRTLDFAPLAISMITSFYETFDADVQRFDPKNKYSAEISDPDKYNDLLSDFSEMGSVLKSAAEFDLEFANLHPGKELTAFTPDYYNHYDGYTVAALLEQRPVIDNYTQLRESKTQFFKSLVKTGTGLNHATSLARGLNYYTDALCGDEIISEKTIELVKAVHVLINYTPYLGDYYDQMFTLLEEGLVLYDKCNKEKEHFYAYLDVILSNTGPSIRGTELTLYDVDQARIGNFEGSPTVANIMGSLLRYPSGSKDNYYTLLTKNEKSVVIWYLTMRLEHDFEQEFKITLAQYCELVK